MESERLTAKDFDRELLNIFDQYVHGDIDRRAFFDRASKFAVGGVTVAGLFEALRPNYAWAQQVAKDDARIRTEYATVQSPQGNGSIKGYLARPAKAGKYPAVLVVHENRGLNPYVEDVARRLATSDFIAFAPDGLTSVGGYPGDEQKGAAAFRTVDGKKMSPATLLAHLNKLGGAHGIGRVDLVENRYVGMKSRGVYETPGGTILHVAHRGIESLTLDREVLHFRDELIPRFAELIYNGYWFSPEREMLQASIDAAQKDVTGTARVKLYKGSCTLAGRKSKHSLYRLDIATFEEDDVYNQKDAEGFIRLNALRLKIRAQRKKASS